MSDYVPSCWIVGDEDGGHAVWEQCDADAGRENGWTVLPMYSDAVLAKAIRQAKAEALREAAEKYGPAQLTFMGTPYDYTRAWLRARADRIAAGGDQT